MASPVPPTPHRAKPFRGLLIEHPDRGPGHLRAYVPDDPRDKPYHVVFDSGEASTGYARALPPVPRRPCLAARPVPRRVVNPRLSPTFACAETLLQRAILEVRL